MKIKLPVQTKEIVNGELKKTESEKEFELDMSMASEIRFETKFPYLAEREDLFTYSKRICEIKDMSAATLLSKLKMLYCWLDTELSFIDFLKIFDLTDIKYIEKLTTKLKEVFELILEGSAEKN